MTDRRATPNTTPHDTRPRTPGPTDAPRPPTGGATARPNGAPHEAIRTDQAPGVRGPERRTPAHAASTGRTTPHDASARGRGTRRLGTHGQEAA
ncbi:hypothetical protein [Streptomyces sp. NPDC057702]|uniref:hypothetical protein n=1 Tax=unclassified Streptomyces TaxID=2593676 RepID=UPI003697B7AB